MQGSRYSPPLPSSKTAEVGAPESEGSFSTGAQTSPLDCRWPRKPALSASSRDMVSISEFLPTMEVTWWWLSAHHTVGQTFLLRSYDKGRRRAHAMLIGTETSPCGVLRTWSISTPTIAMTLPSNFCWMSLGRPIS